MMTREAVVLTGVLAAAFASACNGRVDVGELAGDAGRADQDSSVRTDDTSGDDADVDARVDPDSSHPGPVTTPEAGARVCPSIPAGGDASCFASCCIPAGAIEPFTTIDRVYAWVAGRWQFCSGLASWQNLGAPADAIGVEFDPGSSEPTAIGSTEGGTMIYLVQGPSGPTPGAGFAYQWTYDVSPEGSSYQFNMHSAPNSGWGTTLLYSPCPTELEFASLGYSANASSELVPFY